MKLLEVYDMIRRQLTLTQVLYVDNTYNNTKDKLPEQRYETFFKRVIKVSRSKDLRYFARHGLKLCK